MAPLPRGWIAPVCLLLLGLPALVHAANPATASREFVPDPASVQRYGPAYRYPQAGWIVLHVEGEPYERGYQHGRLLAPEIADYLKSLASARSPKAPGEAWQAMRTLVNALFLRRYDAEYLEEMKGIADGATAAGARFDGRAPDLVDIVALNSEVEAEFLDSALAATATGLEGRRFEGPAATAPRTPPPDHCSAFAAVGPATADGKIVFGHITMFSLRFVRHFNVWLDVRPARGHRVLMQTYPGGIQSGMDYYLNDAGLIVAETTLAQTKFDIDGRALASRIRKALQYADTIDDAVAILKRDNNGLYTNEWLLADTNTNEIAMFELGTHKSRLWRSSEGQWLAGTEGFYWGCNNAKDLEVRLETVPALDGRPANVVFHPSDRDRKWIALYRANKGKIAADFGFEAFTTPPLSAFPSCDAKFTTTAMARELKTYALFGPPLGRVWDPTEAERIRYPDVRPFVGNDWTTLRATPPPSPSSGQAQAVDLARLSKDESSTDRGADDLPPAWRGTLLPGADADIWLAAAFADYERIVALEVSLKAKAADGKLSREDQDRLDVALFAPRSRYLAAVRRLGADPPLSSTTVDWTSDEWYQIASGKGVLLLAALRSMLGDETFLTIMDGFGRDHAGRPVTAVQFFNHAEKIHRGSLNNFFNAWINNQGDPQIPRGGTWSIDSFEAEPERALIIYGTRAEADTQREAAGRLQRSIARRWSNVTVPIKADVDATDDDLKAHHVLLVGRPETNAVAARFARALPLTFGPGSFALRGETYAHPATAVIAAADNPASRRHSLVLFAGLGAEATWRCVEQAADRSAPPAEILLLPAGDRPRRLVAPPADRGAPVALEGVISR